MNNLRQFALFVLLIALVLPALADGTFSQQQGKWVYTASTLEAVVTPDGCLSSLRLVAPGESLAKSPNLLKVVPIPATATTFGGSRGGYFYQDNASLALTDISTVGANALLAQGENASVRYDFSSEKVTLTLTNKTAMPLQYFLVFDLPVTAVRNNATGELVGTAAIRLWQDVTLFQDAHTLRVNGGSRIWGPAEAIGKNGRDSAFQLYEVTLNAQETRTLTLTPGVATADERHAVIALAPELPKRTIQPALTLTPQTAAESNLIVLAPLDYQVFQRKTRTQGEIVVAGVVPSDADTVEVRVLGTPLAGKLSGAWQRVGVNPVLRGFRATLPTPAGGWYRVEYRAMKGAVEVAKASVEHVGVGEVFVVTGQSNAANWGQTPTTTESKMVATFGGAEWRIADDPQPGSLDTGKGGSAWPAFGDALYAKYRVPIGIAVVGQAGASVRNWAPSNPTFVWLTTRMLELGPGGFRAVLWQQGESDVRGTTKDYVDSLSETINASYAITGWKFPWFVAKASYLSPTEPRFASVRDAQQQLCATGLAQPGPDADTLTGVDRDGMHFTATGLQKLGGLWANAVGVYLDKALGK